MRKFWNELIVGKRPGVIAWTGGLIALFTIVPIFSAKYAEFIEQKDAKYKQEAKYKVVDASAQR
jgi:hypothetical protein